MEFKFRERDWERRLWPPSAIGRIQAALHVTRHTRPRFTAERAMVIVSAVVVALLWIGALVR